MVGRAGMEPMVSFVRIGREHPASRQAQGGDVTVADLLFFVALRVVSVIAAAVVHIVFQIAR